MLKELCYRCHEKLAPDHRCKSTKLYLMEIIERDLLDDVDKVTATSGDDGDPQRNKYC